MLKSPHIIKFKELLYNWFKIESSDVKKWMKFPDGAHNQWEHSEITGKWTIRWCVKYVQQK
jgi:hypothetical protein